jgi:hypothetical protein
VAPVGWPMACVAIAQTNPLRVVVGDREGRVAFLNEEAKPEWEENLGRPIGPVSVSTGAEVVAVPAGDRGVVLYRFGGGEIATLDAGEPVRRADITVRGSLIAAETASGRLVLFEGESGIKWEHALGSQPVAWSLGRTGTLLAVGVGKGAVLGFQTGDAPVPAAEPEPEDEPGAAPPAGPELTTEETEARVARILAARRGGGGKGAGAEEKERAPTPKEAAKAGKAPAPAQGPSSDLDLAYLEIEAALRDSLDDSAPAAALAKKGLVRWKKKLPADALPADEAHFRVSGDGEYAVCLLTDGRIVVLDADGNWALQSRTNMPAVLAPRQLTTVVGAWSARELVILDLPTSEARAVLLGRRNTKHFAGSANMSFYCCIDVADKLRAFVGEAEVPTWKKSIEGGATGLEVSPDGRTILVPDATGRFRYFDSRGNLVRKFRFADAGEHRILLLADTFTVFVTPEGRLTVLDNAGEELMVRRVFQTIIGGELMGDGFGVYGEDGECAVVVPREDTVWEFRPPPGRVRVRKPSNMDPLVVHALNDVVTVFSGYKRKLDVVWRYACSGDIAAFDADAEARTVVALADEKVYRLGAE